MRIRSHSFLRGSAPAWTVLAVLLLAAPAGAQKARRAAPPTPAPAPRPCPLALAPEGVYRLVMKDGSYQPFSKCELVGERVRYLSAERYEWEEIPEALVDWEASTKYEQARQAGEVPSGGLRIVGADDEPSRKADAARTPEVVPGLRLPDSSGVFLLDQFQGKPELIELTQNGGEINQQRGKNVLRAALNPFAGSKQSIELKGPRAQVQAHVLQPVLYLNLEPGESDAADAEGSSQADATAHPIPPLAARYRIARVARKKDSRVLGNLKVAFTGKLSQEQQLVPTNAEIVSGPWIRLTLLQPLPPGEYAVVEMLGEKEMNLYVWDFGLDPAAPESPQVWRETPVSEPGKDQPPALTNRPK